MYNCFRRVGKQTIKRLFYLFISTLAISTFVRRPMLAVVREQHRSASKPTNVSDDPHPGFLIHTPHCSIPDIKMDDPSVAEFKVLNPKPMNCSGRPPLTYADGLALYLNKTALKFYSETEGRKNFTCCYRGIEKLKHDGTPKPSGWGGFSPALFPLVCLPLFCIPPKTNLTKTCTPISMDSATPIAEDGVLAMCFDIKSSSPKSQEPREAFYVNVHTFLQPRRTEDKRRRFKEKGGWKKESVALNVLIVETDSVSRQNLKRNMPQTFHYLTKEMEAVDLRGYNKVGDNTYPNIVPILTGMSAEEHKKYPCGYLSTEFNNRECPALWNDFSRAGYVTIYAGDTFRPGIIPFQKESIDQEPTDYYNVPYSVASDEFIGHSNRIKRIFHQCQGSHSSVEVALNYALDITKTFREVPYFGFLSLVSVTHVSIPQYAALVDDVYYNFLKTLNESDLLNRTVLLFVSDHGMRLGKILNTYAGKLEERLPYAMILFPKWFKKEYKNTWDTLQLNRHRLVSNYDLHLTMQDILQKGFEKSTNPKTEFGRGQSLFLEIPSNRSCHNASIPVEFCTCLKTEYLTNSELTQELAQFVIDVINSFLTNESTCAQLHLNKVLKAKWGFPDKLVLPGRGDFVETYEVTFSTAPGDGQFEAIIMKTGDRMAIPGSITRTNPDDAQSYCVTDDAHKAYCYCRDLQASAT